MPTERFAARDCFFGAVPPPMQEVEGNPRIGETLGQSFMTDAVDVAWPRKTREMHNHHMNSTVWNPFAFRADDVVVAT